MEVELTVTFNNNIRPMWVDWIATLPLLARNDMSRFHVLVSKWRKYSYSAGIKQLVCRFYLIFDFGSKISLIVSPIRLKDKTAINIRNPGVKSHGR